MKRKSVRVLVTGAGSGVGQGIIKSLRISAVPATVIAADIEPLNSGLFRADEAALIPRVESAGALARICSVLRANRVDVVMIGSEFDLTFFAAHKDEIELRTGALVIVSPLETVHIADDKWLTAEWLRRNGLPFAETVPCATLRDARRTARAWGFPLVLKTRSGTSNRHVHMIDDMRALESAFETVPKPMLQRMIARPSSRLDREYTCSVFRCADGSLLGPFTARRTLRGGSSWAIEVVKVPKLFPLLLKIGDRLPTMGSLNIQLMIGRSGPVPFEFNARFSGTTAVRAHFGFNEPAMALQSHFLGERVAAPKIREGLALRYLEEVFVDGVLAGDLARRRLPKGTVRPWF